MHLQNVSAAQKWVPPYCSHCSSFLASSWQKDIGCLGHLEYPPAGLRGLTYLSPGHSLFPSYVIRFTLKGTGLWYLMTTWHCHIEWTTMTGQYTIDCNRLLLVYNAGRGISQIDFITVPQSSLYPCVENLRSISNIIGKRHWIIYHIYMAWNSFMCDWMIYPQDRWVAKFCEHVKLVMIRCQAKLTLICRYKIWSFKSWTFLWIWHSQMGSRKLRKLAQRRCSILPGNLQLEL